MFLSIEIWQHQAKRLRMFLGAQSSRASLVCLNADGYTFEKGKSYLSRRNAVAVHKMRLYRWAPQWRVVQTPWRVADSMAGCIDQGV